MCLLEAGIKLKARAAGLLLTLLAVPFPAAATLGEEVGSVSTDQKQLQAALQVTSTGKFAVHELRLASGITVKEYVSPAGMVFALSWQGPYLPDLQQLLGRYFEQYAGAVRDKGAAPGARAIDESGLVVQSGGRMRAFFGRAYIPQMLPRGVLAAEIQ